MKKARGVKVARKAKSESNPIVDHIIADGALDHWVKAFRSASVLDQAELLSDIIVALLSLTDAGPIPVLLATNEMATQAIDRLVLMGTMEQLAGSIKEMQDFVRDFDISGVRGKKPVQPARPKLVAGKPEKVVLSDEEKKQVQLAAESTWKAIGNDCEAANGKPLSKAAVVEVVMDADHMHHFEGVYSHNWPAVYAKFKQLPLKTAQKLVREGIFGK